jgi:hypothetical protein
MATAPLELIAVEVRAEIDQLVRDMPQASRVVDTSMDQIDRSVKSTERSIAVSSANMGNSMAKTGGVSRVLGQQLSQVGQQALATGNVFQALAIQLPDIALGMSSAAGSTSKFAAFLGGPWGTALVLATSVAAAFIPQLLGIGDAAGDSVPEVDALTAAIKRLKNAQGGIGDVGQAEKRIGELQSQRLALTTALDRASTRAELGQNNARRARVKAIDDEIAGLRGLVQWNEVEIQGKKNAQEYEERSTRAKDRGAKASKGKSDADRAAAQAAREAAAAQKELEQALAGLVGRYDPAREAAERFRDTMADIDRLVSAGQLGQADAIGYRLKAAAEQASAIAEAASKELRATLGFEMGGSDDPFRKMFEAQDRARDERERRDYEATERIANQEREIREAGIRTAATLYEDLFRGGTSAIWDDFEDIGLKVISRVLAQLAFSQLGGGGGFDIGSAFSTAIGAVFGVPGFASGGSFTIGGRGGADRNALSLNGRQIANVSRGETLSIGKGGGSRQTVVNQTFVLDNRYGITTPELIDYVNSTARKAGEQAYGRAVTDTPVIMARRDRYGR